MSAATDKLYWRTRKAVQRRLKREGRRYHQVPISSEFLDHLVRIGRAAPGERLTDAQIGELAGVELHKHALSSRDRDNPSRSG